MKIRSIIVGRSPGADIQIDDEYASPRHCEIYQDANRHWWVADLSSTNGTQVRRGGGTLKVQPLCLLRQGDVIVVGRTALPAWDVTT